MTKNQDIKRLSRKLVQQIASLYKILEKIGYSYRLKLPQSIKVYSIFSPNKLYKALEDLLPSQKNLLLDLIKVNRDLEQEIDYILSIQLVYKQLIYKIQQRGYNTDSNKYPTSNLQNTLKALQDFYIAYPSLSRLLKNLKYQLEYTKNDIFLKK